MFAETSFNKTMHITNRLLDTYAIRGEVLADNIANVSTPNFKRSDVTFEYQLGRALASEKKEGLVAKVTDSRHIPFQIPLDYRSVEPNVVVEYDTNYRNDKNNVDIDVEMAEEAKNTMRYQMFTQIASMQYKMVRNAIGTA